MSPSRTLVTGLSMALVSDLLVPAQAQAATSDTVAEAAPPSNPAKDAANAKDNTIVVYGRALPQIGVASSGSQGVVGYEDFEDRPLSRVGELVENVPGVIATQHSGTGKANQYFLRGFNLDHGTDFAGFVDGVPVNMRSHGHGQGYMDLNFLIPELVQRIDYRKGPYFSDVGDFSAAGTVAFRTKSTLAPMAQVTAGSYGYYRALVAGSFAAGDKDVLLALDGTRNNGPWTLDEDLHKINAFAKITASDWSLSLSAYHADWNATDQVPERAIADGTISRYGNIDPYLGGRTTRLNATLNGSAGATEWTAYATYYDFALTSNFTYYLEDATNGDEFQQADRRGVFGGSLRHHIATSLAGLPVAITLGGETRYDRIGKVGLYHSVEGVRTSTVREDSVDEYSGALYGEAQVTLTPSLRLSAGLRGDLLGYDVASDLAANSGHGWATMLEPKVRLAWRVAAPLELYADYGESYHSNDVRGATITVDPASGEAAKSVAPLVRARGSELGARIETGRFTASLVGFYLTLGSELVYTGDGGTTEANAASRRYGAEASLFWRPTSWLTLDASGALTHARFTGVAEDERYIPNSVSQVLSGGVSLDLPAAITATLRLRHFGSAPLIEDNSKRSQPTTLVNLGLYKALGRARLSLDVLNLFNAHDADITYYYASRLQGEASDGVEDYHIHPVEPRQFRVTLRYTL